jgi:ATP/maltotriose-dependent transcriptional regulator MalT
MYSVHELQNYNVASISRQKFEKLRAKSEKCSTTSYHPSKAVLQKEERQTMQYTRSISQGYLLQAVLENFVDGILILTTHRELLHANESAHRICRLLMQRTTTNSLIPQEIWSVCQSLMDNSKVFHEKRIFIESEIDDKTIKLRIRAKWLQLSNDVSRQTTLHLRNFLLVTLEDCSQTNQGMVLVDVERYGLTDREAEVWRLRQDNMSYKEIAARLYITINTVKKHLKNIYAKQQEVLWFE